jgi:NAD(P)-dependent dehydrogenase (short-subunit alcohol dehydrogenase family)
MDLGIRGKVEIISGAGRGIGRAKPILMAQWGARVVAADIDPDAAEAIVLSTGLEFAQEDDPVKIYGVSK